MKPSTPVPVKYAQTQLGGGTSAQGVAFPGGLDLLTPSLRLQPGALHDALNFEVAPFGGYTRIDGYERIDGHPSPSAAAIVIVQTYGFFQLPGDFGPDFGPDFQPVFDPAAPLLGPPAVGQVVTQAASGASGTVVAVGSDRDTLTTPPAVGVAAVGEVTAPTAGYLVLTMTAGAFDTRSALTTPGPVLIGYAAPQTVSITAQNRALYTAAAADVYRALIGPVPGGGPVLGVVSMMFAGVDCLFAFRATIGGAQTLIYKATPAGWTLVPYFNLAAFTDGGVSRPLDGETLTQGAVSATIMRVMWSAGAWSAVGGTAAGQFVVAAPTGGNFAAGAAHTTSGATVTLAGAQAPVTVQGGGSYEFVKCNFSGQATSKRIYGCDGINPPFEFDGTTYAPISTGLVPNFPAHITFHRNFLFLAQASSLFYCAAGNPFMWNAVAGGGEIATGDIITGMITLPGSQTTPTLGIYMRSNAAFLYGTDPTTFNLVAFNNTVGAVPRSPQNLFDTFFLDDLGVVTLRTTQNWGNFTPATLTKNILPFIARERGNFTASTINRSKSQYRLYFADGFALYCTILNQQYLGAAPMLFKDSMMCVDNTKLVTDVEATYAGGASGYVYQLDVGTSFDGAAISAYFQTAWDPLKSPRVLKRFRAASIEVQGGGYARIDYGWQLGYASDQLAQLPATGSGLALGGVPHWDGFTWDGFVWDGLGLMPTDVDQTGTAENIRVIISSDTNYIASYTVNSIIHHYSLRRGMRV